MTEEIPKHEKLIKLMMMSTSNTDGEALNALRLANKLILDAGWDWDRLLRGKIKVVESPFKGDNPFLRKRKDDDDASDWGQSPVAQARPTPQPVRTPQYSAQSAQGGAATGRVSRPAHPPQNPGVGMMWMWEDSSAMWVRTQDPNYVPPTPAKPRINSTRSNIYAGNCYCCGDWVNNTDGWVFTPSQFNTAAKTSSRSGFAIVCDGCNSSLTPSIGPRPAPRNTGQTTVNAPLGNL